MTTNVRCHPVATPTLPAAGFIGEMLRTTNRSATALVVPGEYLDAVITR